MNRALLSAGGALVVASAIGWVVAGPAGTGAAVVALLVLRWQPSATAVIAAIAVVGVAAATVWAGPVAGPDIGAWVQGRPAAHVVGLIGAIVWLVIGLFGRDEPLDAPMAATDITDDSPRAEGSGSEGLFGSQQPPTSLVVPAVEADGAKVASGERQFLRGSVWLVAGTLTISVGSFLYWLLAAKTATKDDVGSASAMFTAAFLLSLLTSPGMVIAASRFASRPTRSETTLFGWSLLVSGGGALVGAALFVLLAPAKLLEPLEGIPSAGRILALWLLVWGLSVSGLVDVALMGRRRWTTLFLRHLLITAARLAPFPLLGEPSATTLFVLATAAFGFTGLPMLPVVLRVEGAWVDLGTLPDRWRDAVRFALANAVGQIAIQGAGLLAPLLVLAWVDHATFADFYLAWGFMSVVFATVQLLGQTLLVEGSREDAPRLGQMRLALLGGLALTIVATLVSIPFRSLIPLLYGDEFRSTSGLLVPLFLGTVPWVVTVVSLAESRLRADNRAAMVIAVSFAVLAAGGVALGASIDGVDGAALGWLVGSTGAALVSAVPLRRALSTRTDEAVTITSLASEVGGP